MLDTRDVMITKTYLTSALKDFIGQWEPPTVNTQLVWDIKILVGGK